MISLRKFVPSSVVAALFLSLTGCGDITSNPVRGLRPGDASTDGKVGCTGNACKSGGIDARVLLDKSGNAIFVVRTGTYDPVTGVANPDGYFQTLQYKVYNADGKQILVQNVNFNKTGVSLYSAPILFCSNDSDHDDDDNGSSSFGNCATKYDLGWKVSVQANLKGVTGDGNKTDVVREDAVDGYLPDIDMTTQTIVPVGGSVAAGRPTSFTVAIPATKVPAPNGPAAFPAQALCVVTVDNMPQVAGMNVPAFKQYNISYSAGPYVNVPATGAAPCTFSLTLPDGPHTIVVAAFPVIPGDYNYLNNATSTFSFTASNGPDAAAGLLLADFGTGTQVNVATTPIFTGQTATLYQTTSVSGSSPTATTCTISITPPGGSAQVFTATAPAAGGACVVPSYTFAASGTYTYSATVSTTPTDVNPSNNTTTLTFTVSAPAKSVVATVGSLTYSQAKLGGGTHAFTAQDSVYDGYPVTFSAPVNIAFTNTTTGAIKCAAFEGTLDISSSVTWVGPNTFTTAGTPTCAFTRTFTGSTTAAAGTAHNIKIVVSSTDNTIPNLAAPSATSTTGTVNSIVRVDVAQQGIVVTGLTNGIATMNSPTSYVATFKNTDDVHSTTLNCVVLFGGNPVTGVAGYTAGSLTPTIAPGGTGTCSFSFTPNAAAGLEWTVLPGANTVDPNNANDAATTTVAVKSDGKFNLVNTKASVQQEWLGGSATSFTTLTAQQAEVNQIALIVIPNDPSGVLGTFTLAGKLVSNGISYGQGEFTVTNLHMNSCVDSPEIPPPLVGPPNPNMVFHARMCANAIDAQHQQIVVNYGQSLIGSITDQSYKLFTGTVDFHVGMRFTLLHGVPNDFVSGMVSLPVPDPVFIAGAGLWNTDKQNVSVTPTSPDPNPTQPSNPPTP